MSDTEDVIDSMANMIAQQREQIELLTQEVANERQVVADLREFNCAACTTERLDYEDRSAKLAKMEAVVAALKGREWRTASDASFVNGQLDALDAEDGQ